MLEVLLGFLAAPLERERRGEGRVHFGQRRVEPQGGAAGVEGRIELALVTAAVDVEVGVTIRQPGERARKASIDLRGAREQFAGLRGGMAIVPVVQLPAAQVVVVRRDVARRGSPQRVLLLDTQCQDQRLGDPTRNVVLDVENVLQFAVVALRPQAEPGGRVDQLHGHAQPLS